MNLSLTLRVVGTILAGVAFVLVLVGAEGHTAALLGFGGATAIGAGVIPIG